MMETPLELECQDTVVTPEHREMISRQVEKLEHRYGRVTACRIVVKGPGARHQTGGLYDINIRLALPEGREVNVGRTAKADERHSDLAFAINDAFKRARRQLQDHARRLQGEVKLHEGQPVGTIMRLDPAGGFGFLQSNDGREIYFHRNSVLGDKYAELSVGSRIVFVEETGEKGPQASTVKLL
jgi:cold shock CspA family protein/ribosome-associated translation inhibitor RaiA